MKFWKRKAALLMTAVMLSGSFAQTAVIAAEPETEAAETETEETEAAEFTVTAEETDASREAETVKATAESEAPCGPMNSQPSITPDTTSLTLVKGQKFVLSDNTWTSSDKKILSVSKTKAAAKKAGTVKLTHDSQTIDVTVVEPSFENKSVKMIAGEEKTVSLNNAADLDVRYVSMAPNVLFAGEEGQIGALSKGSAVVNAYVNGVMFKYTVKVADVDTSKRDFTKPVDLKPMQSVNIKLNGFKPAKAAWTSGTMVSANEVPKGYVFEDAVVRINKNGKVTAIGEGTTVLTATGGSAEPVSITVNVSEPLNRVMFIPVGSSKPLKLYGVKGNVEWKPLNEGDTAVTVEKNKAKANKIGTVILKAEVEHFTYNTFIFAEDPTITTDGISKKGNKYSLEMKSGSTAQIEYSFLYQTVAYKSSDCSVAYADEDGVIHARKAGSAKLSGKIDGKAVTINVKVQESSEKADSLEEYAKSKGFTVYGYGTARYNDDHKSSAPNKPKPDKVLWRANIPDPEAQAGDLAFIRLVEVKDDMVSIDVFYGVYDGVNLLCPMDVAYEVIDKLVDDPYVESTEGSGPFYYFEPYSQYITFDFY